MKIVGEMDRTFIHSRMPSRENFLQAFTTIVFFVYSWSVRGFLFRFPSFIRYLPAGEIIVVFLYMMAFALVESFLVAGGLFVLSIILPKKVLSEGFAHKTLIILLVSAVELIIARQSLRFDLTMYVSLVLLVFLMYFVHRLVSIQKALNNLIDGLSIFAYLYVPLGILSFVIVLIRNLI